MMSSETGQLNIPGEAVGEAVVGSGRWARDWGSVVGFALLIALSAQIKFYPPGSLVPVTLQTVVVLLCGFWLRPVLAVGATVTYLTVGLGATRLVPTLPFFAALHVGSTLGYLVGFVAAAGVVSYLSRVSSPLTLGAVLVISTLGVGLIFLGGVLWLTLLTGDLATAGALGLAPFVGWAAVKIALTVTLVEGGRCWGLSPRR